MDISVIIPSLNGRKYFDEFLSSVIKECEGTPYKAEIVIVDDGSEDDSMAYLESIASDILKPYRNIKKGRKVPWTSQRIKTGITSSRSVICSRTSAG